MDEKTITAQEFAQHGAPAGYEAAHYFNPESPGTKLGTLLVKAEQPEDGGQILLIGVQNRGYWVAPDHLLYLFPVMDYELPDTPTTPEVPPDLPDGAGRLTLDMLWKLSGAADAGFDVGDGETE